MKPQYFFVLAGCLFALTFTSLVLLLIS